MLEQEKAVQFRFDSSEKSLSEKFADLGLPEFARVYSCIGLQNIFGWQNIEKTESFHETWLYLPDDKIESILTTQRSFNGLSAREATEKLSFKIDDQNVYPICSAGKINCVIAVPEGKELFANNPDFEKLRNIEKFMGGPEKSDSIQMAFEFVSRLFDCKQSYAEFAQRLLGFITDQVDKSYAGLYWQDSEEFHRRWAYGDLKFSDKLPLNIHSKRVERWKEANQQGKAFIPAELVQIEPVFVQSPPSFLFVYQTPNFGDREQWLVLAVPGDVSNAAIARIKIIASLLRSIDDDRMSGYVEIVEMFSQVLQDDHKLLPIEEAIKLSFRLMDSKIKMKSLCLLDTDNSKINCLKNAEGQTVVVESRVNEIPDIAWQVIETGQIAYLESRPNEIEDYSTTEESDESYRVFCPVILKDHSTALMSAEFTSEVQRAKQFENLFIICAKFLAVSLSLGRVSSDSPKVVGTPDSEVSETLAISRLKTISKLNFGYFHELVEHLSVILGQAEIIDYDLQHSRKPVTANNLIRSTERIVRASISLAEGLNKLKDVSTIKSMENGKFISADKFLRLLPTITYGHYLTVKDNKNVEVTVSTKVDRSVSFDLPILHVYDIILPLLITIMDESLCSGKLYVSITEHFGRPAIRMSYSKKLLGKMTTDKLCDKVFKYFKSKRNEDDETSVEFDGARVLFGDIEGDIAQAIYTLVNVPYPIED